MQKFTLLFLLTSSFLNAQHLEKTYFGRGHNYSTVYSYSVTEISILNDSLFTRLDYSLPNVKEWKNYKKYRPNKQVLRISKRGEFYVFVDSTNTNEILELYTIKITNNKLTYFFKDPKGNLSNGFAFRRKKGSL